MRIEILGPSGVGKTTTLRAAQALRADEPEWMGPIEADEFVRKSPRDQKKRLTRRAMDSPAKREFIDHCISVVVASSMLPSQQVSALSILQSSCYESLVLEDLLDDTVLVHDELLLHRAYSLLLYSDNVERDATTYFNLVPVPDAAVVFVADEATILSRVQNRERLPNCYAGLDESGISGTIAAGMTVASVAEDILRSRGVAVVTIDTSADVESSALELYDFCAKSKLEE